MRKLLLILVVALVPEMASAQVITTAPIMRRVRFGSDGEACATQPCKVLTAVALNASAALRTFKLNVSGLSKVTVQVDLTRAAATDLQLTCTASLNSARSYGNITSTSISSGTGTMRTYHDSYATTATVNVLYEYDARTYDFLKCVVSGTSGGASDYVTVYAIGAVGQ